MKFFTPFFLFFLVSSHAYSASTRALEEEIAEIRRILEAQSSTRATESNQLQQLLSEFQKLHGQVDQSLHQSEEQAKQVEDLKRRLEVLEDKNQNLVTQLEELKNAGLLPVAQVKNLEEFKTYQKGLSRINALEYRPAIKDLQTFLATSPKSLYAPHAQYWIGEAYYAMGDYTAAVAEYQKVIKKYPKSSKAPTCLLKQGNAFFKMQSFTDAKAFYSKLFSQYPASGEAILARAQVAKIDQILQQRAKEAIEQKSLVQ